MSLAAQGKKAEATEAAVRAAEASNQAISQPEPANSQSGPSITASNFIMISFGPYIIGGWRPNIISDSSQGFTGGIKVAEVSITGCVTIKNNDDSTNIFLNLQGNWTDKSSDLHSTTNIIPGTVTLSYKTKTGIQAQVVLKVPSELMSYLKETNTPQNFRLFYTNQGRVPLYENCTDMSLTINFYTAGDYSIEEAGAFTRPSSITIDLL